MWRAPAIQIAHVDSPLTPRNRIFRNGLMRYRNRVGRGPVTSAQMQNRASFTGFCKGSRIQRVLAHLLFPKSRINFFPIRVTPARQMHRQLPAIELVVRPRR
jgi:hypothetical protein